MGFSRGPHAVTRGGSLFPCVGMWGMLCFTAMRDKLRERKPQHDRVFQYNNCTQAVSTIYCYVHMNTYPIIKMCLFNAGHFSTMPATQLQNQSTLIAEESMLQSSNEHFMNTVFIFVSCSQLVLSCTYIASSYSKVKSHTGQVRLQLHS